MNNQFNFQRFTTFALRDAATDKKYYLLGLIAIVMFMTAVITENPLARNVYGMQEVTPDCTIFYIFYGRIKALVFLLSCLMIFLSNLGFASFYRHDRRLQTLLLPVSSGELFVWGVIKPWIQFGVILLFIVGIVIYAQHVTYRVVTGVDEFVINILFNESTSRGIVTGLDYAQPLPLSTLLGYYLEKTPEIFRWGFYLLFLNSVAGWASARYGYTGAVRAFVAPFVLVMSIVVMFEPFVKQLLRTINCNVDNALFILHIPVSVLISASVVFYLLTWREVKRKTMKS